MDICWSFHLSPSQFGLRFLCVVSHQDCIVGHLSLSTSPLLVAKNQIFLCNRPRKLPTVTLSSKSPWWPFSRTPLVVNNQTSIWWTTDELPPFASACIHLMTNGQTLFYQTKLFGQQPDFSFHRWSLLDSGQPSTRLLSVANQATLMTNCRTLSSTRLDSLANGSVYLSSGWSTIEFSHSSGHRCWTTIELSHPIRPALGVSFPPDYLDGHWLTLFIVVYL